MAFLDGADLLLSDHKSIVVDAEHISHTLARLDLLAGADLVKRPRELGSVHLAVLRMRGDQKSAASGIEIRTAKFSDPLCQFVPCQVNIPAEILLPDDVHTDRKLISIREELTDVEVLVLKSSDSRNRHGVRHVNILLV